MKIKLSDHFSYGRILRFTLPSIAMMIFTSIYGVVDGFFVSNFVGKTSFAAVNFIFPFLMMLGAVGFMFGTGGSALIAKTLGEGKRDKANRLFSLFLLVSFLCGVAISVCGFFVIRPLSSALGADGQMLDDCVTYGRVLLISLPFYILQLGFQSYFVTAEKPQLGLAFTVAAGVTNMVLDALLVAVFRFGLVGAAAATAASEIVGGLAPVFYFSFKNSSLLKIVKPHFDGRSLLRACTNGSSELLSNISMSAVGLLYNVQLIKYAGENGVAAYGVLMYVNFVFISTFIGYSVGTAPITSFNFGAKNKAELKNVLRKSLVIIGCLSVFMLLISQVLSRPLASIFVGYDESLYSLTVRAFSIFSFSFLFAGLGVFGSSFFTALNNGLVSAVISFLRTLVFQISAVLIFPLIWEIDGIWLSVVVAEAMAVVVTAIFLLAKRKRYGY